MHVQDSQHYRGLARDYGENADAIALAFRGLTERNGGPITQLFHQPTGDWWCGGRGPSDGCKYRSDHVGHTHVAILPGVSENDLLRIGGQKKVADPATKDSPSVLERVAGALNPLGGGVLGAVMPSNPLNTISDAASAAVSIAKTVARFATFMAERGRYLLLVLAGVLLAIAGVVFLGKDLGMPALTKLAKSAA